MVTHRFFPANMPLSYYNEDIAIATVNYKKFCITDLCYIAIGLTDARTKMPTPIDVSFSHWKAKIKQYTYRYTSYLTENTVQFHYKDQSVNTIQ
jgi:hypothetical protein